MRQRLLWKLLIGHIVPVFVVIALVVRRAIDRSAADYFTVLVERYHVAPVDAQRIFLAAIHRDLVWGALTALALTLLLTYLLTRWVLRPLSRITDITRQVADGDYSGRVDVDSRYEVGRLADAFNHMAEIGRAHV